MDVCSECGSSQVEALSLAGHTVNECGLCGALSGDPRAVRAIVDARQAAADGVDAHLFPLLRVLGGLEGLRVSGSGASRSGRSPYVEFQVVDVAGLVQLENLAKSLRLQHSLELDWRIEVGFDRAMVFVLRPSPARDDAGAAAAARRDLEEIAAALERDSKLSWWRRPGR